MSLNGKSAHGKTKRHHYYDHPRTLKSYENGHIHKCEVQRRNAEKTEGTVLQSLKRILLEPGQIEKGIAAFKKNQNKEAPRIEKDIKQATFEVKVIHQKIKNLVDRVSELPSDISATPMYDRIKDLQKQIEDKEKGILRLEKDRGNYSGGNISDVGLKALIEKTIQRLEEAPKEKQREIFENVIQFAELSPGRIRLGVYSESDHQRPKKTIRVTRKGGSGESGGLGCSRTIKVGGEDLMVGELRAVVIFDLK